MKIVEKIDELQQCIKTARQNGTVGFVPTMGALHEGHISLVEKSKSMDAYSVASIFVNPTQFNDPKDLERYPRNFERDAKMLEFAGCDLVFAPSVQEMYPKPDQRKFDFGSLEDVMEGKHRPGHFNGVGQIVSKLFDAVQSDNAYFGLKDFQQLAVIRKLVDDYQYNTNIVPCEIIREKDGLAMSSRNQLLQTEKRQEAPIIYKTLCQVRERFEKNRLKDIYSYVEDIFKHNPQLDLEYFEIVDDKTLQPIHSIPVKTPVTACIAVHAGLVRLIDNIQLNS